VPTGDIYSHMAMHTKSRVRRHSTPDRLSVVFGALADPTRRAMLNRLRARELTVTELAKPFNMSQPTISKHLKVLERAGLVVRGRDAQFRPRALHAAPLKDANHYLELFRAQWDDRLDRLDAYVARLQQKS
jgi:DNA-binding transcriptional ArsR family regulator